MNIVSVDTLNYWADDTLTDK